MRRLRASASAVFGAELPAGTEQLVREGARELQLGRLRLTVAPDGGRSLSADVRVAPLPREAVFPAFSHAASLTRLVVQGGLGAHKWADRSLVEPAEADGAVALIVDVDGAVLEASRGTVFIVEDGVIVTPPADGRLLPGVTRRRVLDLVPVREEPVPLDRLLEADEVFLTGSVRGVEPVRDYNGARRWSEGTLTRAVSDDLRRRWEDGA